MVFFGSDETLRASPITQRSFDHNNIIINKSLFKKGVDNWIYFHSKIIYPPVDDLVVMQILATQQDLDIGVIRL